MKLNPQLIKRQGKSEFVVLLIEDYEDLRELRDAKEKSQGQKSIPIKEVIAELGL